jgi:predicted phosphodiesterase
MKGKEGWVLVALFLVLMVPALIVIVAEVSRDKSYSHITKYKISDSEKPLRFHVVGDFGNIHSTDEIDGTEPVKFVAHAMKNQALKRPIDFILSAGDNSYPEAYADFDQHIYKLMYDIFQLEGIKAKPWYLVLGNHDCYDDPDYEVHANKLYPMWHMPHKYYHFTRDIDLGKKVGFVFLDGCALTGEGVPYSNSSAVKQYKWLEDVLDEQMKDKDIVWKIVTVHMPLWSPGEYHGDNDILKLHLYPILFKYGVDLVISGHDHIMSYSISRYINGKAQPFVPKHDSIACSFGSFFPFDHAVDWEQGQGMHQLLQGASGRELYKNCPDSVTPMADLMFTTSRYGFSEVYLDQSLIKIDYFDIEGDLPIFTTRILRNS